MTISELINELSLFSQTRYRIFAAADTDRHRRLTLRGAAFICRLCGRSDNWKPEGGLPNLPRSWTCECGTEPHLEGVVRQIDSIPHHLVGRVEEV